MNNPGIVIQTRLTSSRFPNKALYPILGKAFSVLARFLRADTVDLYDLSCRQACRYPNRIRDRFILARLAFGYFCCQLFDGGSGNAAPGSGVAAFPVRQRG